jgi:hypothetical protein
MKIFGHDIDLNKNEAKNFRLGNEITFPSVVASDAGFVFFHSANSKFYGYDGIAWTELGLGGSGGGGSSWAEAELIPYTTVGTIPGEASSITVPSGTLAVNGDILEFQYLMQSTSINSNTVSINVNFASVGHGLGNLTAVTGTLSYVIKGTIQRKTSTTFDITILLTHGFTDTLAVFADTVSSGNFDVTNYNLVLDIQDSGGGNNLTMISGFVKYTSIG